MIQNNLPLSANITEIFSSIQGEGPFIGYKQIFIRFANCNLRCNYCDTPFSTEQFCRIEKGFASGDFTEFKNPISTEELRDIISSLSPQQCHSISLTGGEPLLQTEFLKEFLPMIKIPVYLETNGTLPEKLAEIIDLVDIIAMDIKIESSTHQPAQWEKHNEFIDMALNHNKKLFAKIVVSSQIKKEETEKLIALTKFKNFEVIIQPMNSKNKQLEPSNELLYKIQENFARDGIIARIIPQVHKLLGVL